MKVGRRSSPNSSAGGSGARAESRASRQTEQAPESVSESQAVERDQEPRAERVGRAASPAIVVLQPATNAAQVVMLLIGMVYLGIGSVALSRGGFDDLNVQNQVAGIPHTPLLGFMELVFGAIVVLAAAMPYAGRWVLLGAGALLSVWGLVLVITPSTFNSALGVETLNGWMYILTGMATLLVGIIMPRAADYGREP